MSQHQIWLEKRLLPEAKGDFRLGAELYDRKLAFALFSPLSRAGDPCARGSRARRDARRDVRIARTCSRAGATRPRLPRSRTTRNSSAPSRPRSSSRTRSVRRATRVLDAARATLADATEFVREKNLVTLPDEPLEIIAMPEFQQGVALAYCDSPGPLEAGQKTFYAVSPIPKHWTRAQMDSFLREYNSRSIHNLTIHEAMPGHYLQLAHSNRYPSTLRAVLASGPFIEGWAVYTERVMIDAGLPGRRSAHAAHPAEVVPAQRSSTRCSTRPCTSTACRAKRR